MKYWPIVILLATCYGRRPADDEPDEEDDEWMDYIPEDDLNEFKHRGQAQSSYVRTDADGHSLFQDDIRGCEVSNEPQCPRPADAEDWRGDRTIDSHVVVNYFIKGDRNGRLGRLIQTATEQIESSTVSDTNESPCVVFNVIDDPGPDPEKRVISFSRDTRCTADWGTQKTSNLAITVCDECNNSTQIGKLIHLILHTFGFPKEHMRNDRDKHVKIFWENVAQGRKDEFIMDDKSVTYEDPYDYKSVMHPEYTFLSKGNSATITGISKYRRVKIGLRETLSEYDKLKLQRMFCGVRRKTNSKERRFPIKESQPCPEIIPSKPVTVVKYKATILTTTVTETSTTTSTMFLPATPRQVFNARIVTMPKPTVVTSTPPDDSDDDEEAETTTTRKRKQLRFEPSIGISPTPSKRCPEGLITVTNFQTMIRTTSFTVYPNEAFTTRESRVLRKSFWYSPPDEDNGPKDFLTLSTEWPQFVFAGRATKVDTIKYAATIKEFSTQYEEYIRDDGACLNQRKLETRVFNC